ncbi:MAG: hypothetical protein E4H14_11900 [Candidatus Thorarchaeota archaeon]|nr:MAG: hypothetical protein E4H14_11900 [Candidatus Thorarchaeota archaeon]
METPINLLKRIDDELQSISQMRQFIYNVQCNLGISDGMYTIRFESDDETLDEQHFSHTSDVIRLLRRPMVEGVPLQSSSDVGAYFTGNPYEDIDYGGLQLLQPIVAHSLGGIITREALMLHRDDLDTAGISIDKVITLGTPNHGTWLANPANQWATLLTLIGGIINYGQYWPSPVFHSVSPFSPLILDLNSYYPLDESDGIEWYTAAGYDPIMSLLTFSIHFDSSDPLVAVGKAHLSFTGVQESVTYDGIGHMGLINYDGTGGTFLDVFSWLCTGEDYDGDGLTDDAERYTWNTNPYDADCDNDGLTDYEELVVYNTNPYNPNSDGDAITDGTEIAWNYDPLDSSSPIQASSLIQSMLIVSGSTVTVTARSLTGVTKVQFYAQYKNYLGTWTSYQLIGTDYSAPFRKTWTIPTGYIAIRVMVKAYNSGNIYLGCDVAYQSISTGGGGGDPVPI